MSSSKTTVLPMLGAGNPTLSFILICSLEQKQAVLEDRFEQPEAPKTDGDEGCGFS